MPFQKGHKLGKGRPKGSKNTLPLIRDRLFRILLRRITHDKDLDTVDTATLIKFASACLPKDMSLAINRAPDITYISNTPRPALSNDLNKDTYSFTGLNSVDTLPTPTTQVVVSTVSPSNISTDISNQSNTVIKNNPGSEDSGEVIDLVPSEEV